MKSIVDNTTTAVALGGVTSPYWLHALDGLSSVAADLVPIFGAAWLVIKIYEYFKHGRGVE